MGRSQWEQGGRTAWWPRLGSVALAVSVLVAVIIVAGIRNSAAGAGHSAPPAAGNPQFPDLSHELPELRTATSRTFATEAGRMFTQVFTERVNYRADGRWRSIDNSLAPAGPAAFRNRAGGHEVVLPRRLAVGQPVRVSAGGESLEMAPRRGGAVAAVSDARATYADVEPNVDVRYEVEADGLKETIELGGPDVPRRYVFDVELSDGLRLERRANGAVEAVDGDDRVAFVIPAPYVWDQSAAGPEHEPVSLRVADGGRAVVLEIDDAYLSDSARAWPVQVDPSVEIGSPGKDCYLSADPASAGSSFCNLDYLRVGQIGGHDHNALLHFDIPTHVPKHTVVVESWIGMYLRSQASTRYQDWTVHRVTRPWNNNEASWNNAALGTAWQTPGGDYESTPALIKHIGGGTWTGWSFWGIPALVQSWIDGTPDYGVVVKSRVAPPLNGLTFASGEAASSKPYLGLEYEPRYGALDHYSFLSPEPVASPDVPQRPEWPELEHANLNVGNGNLYVEPPPVAAQDLLTRRFFNGLSSGTTALGRAWTGVATGVKVRDMPNSTLAFYDPSGAVVRFDSDGNGGFVAPPGFHGAARLNSDGRYVVTSYTHDVEYVFAPMAPRRLERLTVAGGHSYQLAYNASGVLSTATDETGAVTRFTSDTSGRITAITPPVGAATTFTYSAAGNLETAVEPGIGTTRYVYGSYNRLTEIQLPDGARLAYTYSTTTADRRPLSMKHTSATGAVTSADVTYELGRTVFRAGTRTATYHYNGDLRVTRVVDGPSPPSAKLSGTLFDRRGQTLPAGTYTLSVLGQSPAPDVGVRDISIRVDGTQEHFVEQTCPTGGCPQSTSWTFDTGAFAAGRHYIDVVITDQAGDATVTGFDVVVPETEVLAPQPEPEPTATELRVKAKEFRTTFGFVATDAHIDQVEANPANHVSVPRHGVALDLTERTTMDQRSDIQQAKQIIEEYGASQAPDSYAEVYTDNTAGYLVYVGFKTELDRHMTALRAQFPYPDKLRGFQATYGRRELLALVDRIEADDASLQAAGITLTSVGMNVKANRVDVGVANPTDAQRQTLASRYGAAARLVTATGATASSRYSYRKPKAAGLRIITDRESNRELCTSGFGALAEPYTVAKGKFPFPPIKVKKFQTYFLTAGHCDVAADGGTGHHFLQGGRRMGKAVATNYVSRSATDASIMRVPDRFISRSIYVDFDTNVDVWDTSTYDYDDVGDEVCFSGATTNDVVCGELAEPLSRTVRVIDPHGPNKLVRAQRAIKKSCRPGDSGAPIWHPNRGERLAAGILSSCGNGRTYYSHIHHTLNILENDHDVDDLGLFVRNPRRPGLGG